MFELERMMCSKKFIKGVIFKYKHKTFGFGKNLITEVFKNNKRVL